MATKKKVAKKKASKKTPSKPSPTKSRPTDKDEEDPRNIATLQDAEAGDGRYLESIASGEELARSNPAFAKFEVAKRIAHTLANSTLVPDAYRGRPNDCFVAINMGAELGMEPFQAIQSIAVIEGKPCLYGDGLIGVVRASPLCEWIEETISEDGKSATCTTKRRGDLNPITATYTMQDAITAGINTKNNWRKHPKRMLQMRARAYCLRDAYPDLLKGLGVVEERVDFEETPKPIQSYELPSKPTSQVIPTEPEFDDAEPPTLDEVVHAIKQCDTMPQLLEAGKLAQRLTKADDKNQARVIYKKWKATLLDEGGDVPA